MQRGGTAEETWPLSIGGRCRSRDGRCREAVGVGRWPLVKWFKQRQCPNYVRVLLFAGERYPFEFKVTVKTFLKMKIDLLDIT